MPPRQAEIILSALKPELTGVRRRTEVRVERARGGVSIDIRASDLVAARAAANSFIRLLDLSISMYRVVGSER